MAEERNVTQTAHSSDGKGGKRMTQEMQDFIGGLVPDAQLCQLKYGIFSSLTIAQAILESGWGKSRLAQEGNNLFGIKGDYLGSSINIESSEYIDDKTVKIISPFRAYPSTRASVIDHAEFLQKPRYDAVRAAKTPAEACEAIQAAGYATSPDYGAYLQRLIRTYELDRYDVLTECPYARYLALTALNTEETS